MKKTSILLLTVMSLFILSCESSDGIPENPEIVDTFKLLSVNSEGGIFEIGNNTGETHKIGQIPSQANLIQLPTICNIGSKIYALEATYVPAPNILMVYNKLTGSTSTVQLVLPISITSTMLDPFITNLQYDGSKLIAIVSENMPNDTHPNKMVSINLLNYEVSDMEISFFQRAVTSTELVNNKLYVSTRLGGLLEVDLTDKSVTELKADGVQINETRLAKINNSRIALMKSGIPGIVNGVKPFEYNIDNNTFSDKSAGNVFSVGNITGRSFFYNQEYLNIVFKTDHKYGILKINYESNAIGFVELDNNVLGSNAIIVDILD